jgi:hypothetical protein
LPILKTPRLVLLPPLMLPLPLLVLQVVEVEVEVEVEVMLPVLPETHLL